MQLPLAALAVVAPDKVRDYLLSPTHPVGRHKARFFGSLGYWRPRWEVLAVALRTIARRGEAVKIPTPPYGTTYLVGGMPRGPGGRESWVETVWIIRADAPRPHLVTAFPGAPR